jgi:hypothetical protein
MKKILCALLTFALVGCVTTSPIKTELKSNIHSITVVSLLGNELEFTKVGFTAFNNDHFVRDSTDWNIDSEVQKTTSRALQQSSPNIKIVQVPFDQSELFKIYKSSESWGDYASINRIESELKNKLRQTPVDAILIIYKASGQDPVAHTSIYVQGYGVYYRSLPFVDPTMKPYALFHIALLDAHTLKPITSKYVRSVSTDFGKTEVSWKDQIKNNLSEPMLLDFKSSINTVIKDNLETGLKEMGL